MEFYDIQSHEEPLIKRRSVIVMLSAILCLMYFVITIVLTIDIFTNIGTTDGFISLTTLGPESEGYNCTRVGVVTYDDTMKGVGTFFMLKTVSGGYAKKRVQIGLQKAYLSSFFEDYSDCMGVYQNYSNWPPKHDPIITSGSRSHYYGLDFDSYTTDDLFYMWDNDHDKFTDDDAIYDDYYKDLHFLSLGMEYYMHKKYDAYGITFFVVMRFDSADMHDLDMESVFEQNVIIDYVSSHICSEFQGDKNGPFYCSKPVPAGFLDSLSFAQNTADLFLFLGTTFLGIISAVKNELVEKRIKVFSATTYLFQSLSQLLIPVQWLNIRDYPLKDTKRAAYHISIASTFAGIITFITLFIHYRRLTVKDTFISQDYLEGYGCQHMFSIPFIKWKENVSNNTPPINGNNNSNLLRIDLSNGEARYFSNYTDCAIFATSLCHDWGYSGIWGSDGTDPQGYATIAYSFSERSMQYELFVNSHIPTSTTLAGTSSNTGGINVPNDNDPQSTRKIYTTTDYPIIDGMPPPTGGSYHIIDPQNDTSSLALSHPLSGFTVEGICGLHSNISSDPNDSAPFVKSLCQAYEINRNPPYLCSKVVHQYNFFDLMSITLGSSMFVASAFVIFCIKLRALYNQTQQNIGAMESVDSKDKESTWIHTLAETLYLHAPRNLFKIRDHIEPLMPYKVMPLMSFILIVSSVGMFTISWIYNNGVGKSDFIFVGRISKDISERYLCEPFRNLSGEYKYYDALLDQLAGGPDWSVPTMTVLLNNSYHPSQQECINAIGNSVFCKTDFPSEYFDHIYCSSDHEDIVLRVISAFGYNDDLYPHNEPINATKLLNMNKLKPDLISIMCKPFEYNPPYMCRSNKTTSNLKFMGLAYGHFEIAYGTIVVLVMLYSYWQRRSLKWYTTTSSATKPSRTKQSNTMIESFFTSSSNNSAGNDVNELLQLPQLNVLDLSDITVDDDAITVSTHLGNKSC